MKDIPVFASEFGAASLILKEIPYRHEAYIRIRDSLEPEKLLTECVSFCRMCGAERIYTSGHSWLDKLPLHCAVIEMRGEAKPDPAKVRCLWPVTPETCGEFRKLMNARMAGVDNAGTLEAKDEAWLSSVHAYFAHDGKKLLGIGIMQDDCLRAVASVLPGRGEETLHTLFTLCPGKMLRLEVASTNTRAIRLYENAGFLKTGELSRWYRADQINKGMSRKNT